MDSYNLFDQPWLHVINTIRQPQVISLRTFIQNPDGFSELNFPIPGHNLAVLRYLISLLYCWNQPEDEDEWMERYQGNPFEPIQDFENTFRKYTDLLDPKYPFFQTMEVKNAAKKPVNALLNQLPAESGIRFFRHLITNIHVGMPTMVPTLLSAHLFIPKQAGAGYFKGINAIPLYLFLKGATLKETFMLNLLTKTFLQEKVIARGFMGPIHGPSDLVALDKGEMQPSEISIVKGMNWRSRNIFIHPQQVKTTCALMGNPVEEYVERVDYKAGPKCTDYWWDTMVSRLTTQETSGEQSHYNIEADTFSPVWKGYVSLLIGHTEKNRHWHKPLVLQHYDTLKNRYLNFSVFAHIEAFGFNFKSGGKAFCGMTEEQLIYPKILSQNDDLIDTIKELIENTNACAYALEQSLNILRRDEKHSRGSMMDEGEKYQYWHALSATFNQFLQHISTIFGENPSTNQKEVDANLTEWKVNLEKHTWKFFHQLSSRVPYTSEGFEKLAKAKRSLARRLGIILKLNKEKEEVHAAN